MSVNSFGLLPTHGRAPGSCDQAAYEPALRTDHDAETIQAFQAQQEQEWIKIDYARLYSQLKLVRSVKAIRYVAIMVVILLGAGVVVAATLAAQFYLGIVGRVPTFSARLASRTTPTDQRVVTMFGPKSSGGLDHFDLGVMIWHRKGVKPLKDPNYQDAGEAPGLSIWMFEDKGRVYGELGYALKANSNGSVNAWEPVFQGRVLKHASISTPHSTVVPITIPGPFITDLAQNPWSELVATFTMLPTSNDEKSVMSTQDAVFKSSRPLDSYGSNHSWPLAWIDPFDSVGESTPLDSFLAHTGAGYSLKRYEMNFTDIDSTKGPIFDLHLITSTTLTAAKDYPTYELGDFEKVMRRLEESKIQCRRLGWWNPECTRSFRRDGHFENVIKLDSSKDTPWRYGPFMTTGLSAISKTHQVALPRIELNSTTIAEDFRFDWRLGWSPLSPAKMAIAARLLPEWSTHSVDPFGYKPHERDYLEVFHSFVGQNFNPRAHPITRTAVGFLAIILHYLSVPLLLHYWFVRSHAGGTSTAMFILSYGNMGWMMIQSLYEWWEVVMVWFILKIVVHALLLLRQLTLIARLEVRFENFVPAAIRFRPSSKLEQETREVDGQISWVCQVAFVATCFICIHFGGSAVPRIVHSPMYQGSTDDVPLWFGRSKGITRAFLIGGSLESSLWLLAALSQIRLNYKLRSYGAEYRTTAYLSAAALVLSRISSLFIGWFGPAAATSHFTLWDLISMTVVLSLAVQASSYPGIPGKLMD
ncbi:BZ3500_MvSof-1268-A1-R1_Chr8-1g09803 [Microbotryum saponariae]|uniref:BZ3500_MvSof-1268-A1-R1_Chr8-1g09803 protein n=1 Tax=Microbotryum saponariae TaxID=289078 RepID=A0A2X0LQ48_9BASI|nr:BZ3500_MvSof-1268-A1-R1_Chr8-1g09803 [Microbotryum saponariae]SDA08089.1 BZ3501_MvSof-1269-A2-R1_Chr8-1g09526 [Microbotryum saponariae]